MTPDLTRRQALIGFGSVSLSALLAACGDEQDASEATVTGTATETSQTEGLFGESSACTLTPEMTEGPYYFDADAIRSDIREGKEGVLLRLAIRVRDADTCRPIPNAVVDIWHCDAAGVYSGFESGAGGPPGAGERTDDETYLRGAQVTNSAGIAQFKTVYPGWYRGRTVHIHAKVHLDRSTVLTTQLYFDEGVTAQVYERRPYAANSGRDIFNEDDGLFEEALLLDLSEERGGYLGLISFDVRRA